MNCYFVFEGQTEPVLYRSWLNILVPDLQEVDFATQVVENNYVQFSDAGLPKLYEVVCDAILDINQATARFDYLVVVMDADQLSVQRREEKLQEYIAEHLDIESSLYRNLPEHCELIIIVQKVCIETWFLANQNFVPNHPEATATPNYSSDLLMQYKNYFDVGINDPELMAAEFTSVNKSKLFGCYTRAQFHAKYFNEVYRARTRRKYNKNDPTQVTEPHYLQALINRRQTTNHLATFGSFLDFCKVLNPTLPF